ncbi:MAG TPA: hypothetical protein VLZ11_00735 [Flavobacterium sp.]|nr:hypothetical protein [Flavobacterium sp.]
MKKQLLLFLTIILSLSSYAQADFEKGYYIDNSNNKIECLIRNIDWQSNPTQFYYRISTNDRIETVLVENAVEFGIYGITKYVRKTVNIDRSSEHEFDMSREKNPVYQQETLFLKVLVEGAANLYNYTDGKLLRFFYDKKDTEIQQMIFKVYMTKENVVAINGGYKQQLWMDLKCPSFTLKKFEYLDYNADKLARLFEDYNNCLGQTATNYYKLENKQSFNLNIRPGLNSSSLKLIDGSVSNGNASFGSQMNFRFGVEVEFVVPLKKNKLSFMIEPTYQYFSKAEGNLKHQKVSVDYQSIEMAFGVRHYFTLSERSAIFANGSFIVDLPNGSGFDLEVSPDVELRPSLNFGFGIGYKYDRYSLEVRYHTNRNFVGLETNWETEYQTTSVILGYKLF